MKANIYILIIGSVMLLSSCDKSIFEPKKIDPVDPPVEPTQEYLDSVNLTNKYIGKWIFSEMSKNYLWSDEMPESPDMSAAPATFYTNLLYEYGNTSGDRFSQIVNVANVNNTPQAGYDYVFLSTVGSQYIYAYINYVVEGSPAESAGIKRGDIFLRVNGVKLTRSNYSGLMQEMASTHTLTRGSITENNSLIDADDVTVSVGYVQDDPIFLEKIHTIDGKKIAYLVYNSFTPDNGDGSLEYDRLLNAIFGKFKTEGVTDLVLDLRYNGGGVLSSATNLASMITSMDNVGKVFMNRTYNNNLQKEYLNKYGEEYFIDRFVGSVNGENKNHLGLNKLYVLVSYRTASASELIINGLKPYLDVVLIGRDKTVGKNVGALVVNPTDVRIPWTLHPIIVKISNSENYSDYANGFTPDIYENEYDIKDPKALGDVNEKLLSKALSDITGTVKNMRFGMDIPIEVLKTQLPNRYKNNVYINK